MSAPHPAIILAIFAAAAVLHVLNDRDMRASEDECLAKFEDMGVIHYDSSTGECWFTTRREP